MSDKTAQRENLRDRVINDFTFKGEPSTKQIDLWNRVKKDFKDFRKSVLNIINDLEIARMVMNEIEDTFEHYTYNITLRETERWCNTAIANDFDEDDMNDVEPQKYPVDLRDEDGEKQRLCHLVSEACFQLATNIVQYVPLGRSHSLALTRLQDVRGWLIDLILNYYPDEN